MTRPECSDDRYANWAETGVKDGGGAHVCAVPVCFDPHCPAAPSEPPAEAQQDDERDELPWCYLRDCPEGGRHRITSGRCLRVPPQPSPEVEQDGEVEAIARVLWANHRTPDEPVIPWHAAAGWQQRNYVRMAAAALAAQPSADPEKLRRVRKLADEFERRGRLNADPTTLDSRLHQMVADRIRAALDGERQ